MGVALLVHRGHVRRLARLTVTTLTFHRATDFRIAPRATLSGTALEMGNIKEHALTTDPERVEHFLFTDDVPAGEDEPTSLHLSLLRARTRIELAWLLAETGAPTAAVSLMWETPLVPEQVSSLLVLYTN